MLTMTNLLPCIPSVLSPPVNLGCSRLLSSAIHPSQFLFTTSSLCASVPAPRADPNPFEPLSPNGDQPESRTPGQNVVHPRPLGKQWSCLPISMKGSRLGEQHRL